MACGDCCGPCERAFGTDRLDFELDDTKWKETFARPGGLGAAGDCCSPEAYLAFRATLLLVWSGCTMWSIVNWVGGGYGVGYWFTKMTHLGALAQVAYLSFGALSTYQAIYSSRPDGLGEATPWFVQVTWLLAALTPVLALTVVVLYWGFVYREESRGPTAISVVMHGGNFLVAVLDLVTTRTPFYIAHVYVPLAFGIGYSIFTVIYYLAGGTNEDGVSPYIYSTLDWSNPTGTASLLALNSVVGLPFLYMIIFFIVAARLKCRKSFVQANAEDAKE